MHSSFGIYCVLLRNLLRFPSQMRTFQTMEFVNAMESRIFDWSKRIPLKMTVKEAFVALQAFVDRSDPDTELPNLIHMLQTAERAREAGRPDWFQLACLVHDMGKMMFLIGDESIGMSGKGDGAQYALGGDTWVVGCRIPDRVVLPSLNSCNPDMQDPVYSTEMGIYEPNCGTWYFWFFISIN